jgi:hypothetical protein
MKVKKDVTTARVTLDTLQRLWQEVYLRCDVCKQLASRDHTSHFITWYMNLQSLLIFILGEEPVELNRELKMSIDTGLVFVTSVSRETRTLP